MPELSIIIPSLRPKAIERCVGLIEKGNPDVDFEVILVGPTPFNHPRVVHVFEQEPRGTIAAHRDGYVAAKAPLVCFWADDCYPTAGSLRAMVSFMQERTKPFIGSFRLLSANRQELDQWAVYDRLYACFGCISKESATCVGGVFDGVYRSFWADPDLALRVWSVGGRVEVCPDAFAVIDHINDGLKSGNWERYFNGDAKTFFSRWQTQFSEHHATPETWETINCPVPAQRALEATRPPLAIGMGIPFAPLTTSDQRPGGRMVVIISLSETSAPLQELIAHYSSNELSIVFLLTEAARSLAPKLEPCVGSHGILGVITDCTVPLWEIPRMLGPGWYMLTQGPSALVSPLAGQTVRRTLWEWGALGYTSVATRRHDQGRHDWLYQGVSVWKNFGQRVDHHPEYGVQFTLAQPAPIALLACPVDLIQDASVVAAMQHSVSTQAIGDLLTGAYLEGRFVAPQPLHRDRVRWWADALTGDTVEAVERGVSILAQSMKPQPDEKVAPVATKLWGSLTRLRGKG